MTNHTTVIPPRQYQRPGRGSPTLVTVSDASSFVVNGGSLSQAFSDFRGEAIKATSGSIVTIESGHLSSRGLSLVDAELHIHGAALYKGWNCDVIGGGISAVNSLVPITGGEINTVPGCTGLPSSALLVFGGTAEISGGRISLNNADPEKSVVSVNDGRLVLSGGEIAALGEGVDGGVKLSGNAEFLMTGGHIDINTSDLSRAIVSRGSAKVDVRDGSVTVNAEFGQSVFLATANSEMSISGGIFQGVASFSDSFFEASGGAKMTLSGGSFAFNREIRVGATDRAEIVIIGSGFTTFRSTNRSNR